MGTAGESADAETRKITPTAPLLFHALPAHARPSPGTHQSEGEGGLVKDEVEGRSSRYKGGV